MSKPVSTGNRDDGRRGRSTLSKVVPIIAVVALAASASYTQVSVEGCYYRVARPDLSSPHGDADAGYVEAFFLNASDGPVGISEVLLNGTIVRSCENEEEGLISTLACYGCMVVPSQVLPGSTARIVVKLKQALTGKGSLEIKTADGERYTAEVPSLAPRVITYVGFSSGLDKCYVYVANRADSPLRVTRVTGKQDGKLPVSAAFETTLARGTKRCAVLSFPAGLELGAEVNVAAYGPRGLIDRAKCRVLTDFPMLQERNEGQVLLYCPTHRHGTYGEAMTKVMGLCEAAGMTPDADTTNTTIHICRYEAVAGIPLFSAVADRVRYNTFIPSSYRVSPREFPYSTQLVWAMYLKAASEPRPFDMVVAVENMGEPLFRRRLVLREGTLDSLAGGAKGFYFRGGADSYIQELVKSVRAIENVLRISEPIALQVDCSDEDVTCLAHLVADEGLLLFLVRRKLEDPKAVLRDVEVSFGNDTHVAASAAVRVDSGRFASCQVEKSGELTRVGVGKVDVGTMVLVGPERFIRDVEGTK